MGTPTNKAVLLLRCNRGPVVRNKLLASVWAVPVAAILLSPTPARAGSAGTSCTPFGQLRTEQDAGGGYNLVCNGTVWTSDLTYGSNGAGIGILSDTAPTFPLSFAPSGGSIGVERTTTALKGHPLDGTDLSIQAGGGGSGQTNVNGGNLNLSGGVATGTGTSNIIFKVQTGTGTSGSSDRAVSEFMRVTGTGLGIFTTTPQTKLDVNGTVRIGDGGETCGVTLSGAIRYNTGAVQFCNGTTWANIGAVIPAGSDTQIQFNSGGALGASSNLAWNGTALSVTGDIRYTGVIMDLSDRRFKDNIAPLKNSLQKISALQGVSFTMKSDNNHRTEFGFIAQDVRAIFPELVQQAPEGTLTMNYIGLIGPMAEAIKDQQSEIENLKFGGLGLLLAFFALVAVGWKSLRSPR